MPYRVLTVCTGNICRSPIAEVVLRDRFEAAGLDVEVASAGISDEEAGNPIDPRAARVLREAGYDVPRHRAHRVERREAAAQDLLLPATALHARRLRGLVDDPERVRLIRSFDPDAPRSRDEASLDLADPWYGDLDDFRSTLEQVEAAADGVVDHVRAALRAD